MADDAPLVQGGKGLIDPTSPMAFFLGGGDTANVSLEELKRRRAIALALAARSKGYPKTLGEGLTSFGQDIGDVLAERRLTAQEKAYGERKAADPLARPPGAAAAAADTAAPPAAAIAPPSGPNGAYTEVPTRPVSDDDRRAPARLPAGLLDPALIGPRADASDPAAQRERIARLLNPPPEVAGVVDPTAGAAQPPRGGRLASLSPLGTLSDAPPIGGASVADENPPTPTSIAPMPAQLAQAGAGAALGAPGAAMGPNQVPLPADPGATARPSVAPPPAIPSVFDKPTPEPAVPVTGLVPPETMKPLRKPVAPLRENERMTEEEVRGWALARKYPGDEDMLARAKALMDFGKARRDEAYARRVKEYELDMATYEKDVLARNQYARDYPKLLREHTEATEKAGREKRLADLFPDGVKEAYNRAEKNYADVKQLPAAQSAITNIRSLINSKESMFTGANAVLDLNLAKIAAALGVPPDPKMTNTETFRGMIPPLLSALRPAVVGAGAQSLPEFQMLQDAAAGKITLEKSSILNILGAIEKLNAVAAVNHHKVLMANSRGDPNVQATMFGSYEMPMERFVPPKAVQMLRDNIERNKADVLKVRAEMEEFDRDYYTPGLAAKMLGVRR